MDFNVTTDDQMEKLFIALEQTKIRRDEENFNQWLKKYTYYNDKTVLDIIEAMAKQLTEAVVDKGYKIINQNKLKNDIANFLYNIS